MKHFNLQTRRLLLAYFILHSIDFDEAKTSLIIMTDADQHEKEPEDIMAEFFGFPEHVIIEVLQLYREFGKLAATSYLMDMMNNRELTKLSILATIIP